MSKDAPEIAASNSTTWVGFFATGNIGSPASRSRSTNEVYSWIWLPIRSVRQIQGKSELKHVLWTAFGPHDGCESSHMQDLTGRQHDGMGIEAFEKSGVKTAIVLVRKRELAHEL